MTLGPGGAAPGHLGVVDDFAGLSVQVKLANVLRGPVGHLKINSQCYKNFFSYTMVWRPNKLERWSLSRRHYTQHNDIRQNNAQHKGLVYDTRHK
jgi:hypothetical protein